MSPQHLCACFLNYIKRKVICSDIFVSFKGNVCTVKGLLTLSKVANIYYDQISTLYIYIYRASPTKDL